MASYEEDHNISPTTSSRPSSRPHLDLDDFFQSLSSSSPTATTSSSSSNDAPAFRSLARAFQQLENTDLLQSLISRLLEEAEGGNVKAQGVPEGFLDSLERVGMRRLKREDTCCICASAFLDDPYPLVVRLPCHKDHIFDLECIAPWLKLHQVSSPRSGELGSTALTGWVGEKTCPLDRKDLVKKSPPPVVEDSEEEWDPNYG
ncbi:hypothetical protein EX30DRAFT_372845 [Ascodesmis nigricans]|uniref:RING-type domain-containing protein n=1 Tax=Ascodesmis nigricans TaxID=341454 RepID=A0A4S2MQR7_9PEZI|nr:hypothetical protein EX30DRAFT_372845 [Ascodesmis nigricans]